MRIVVSLGGNALLKPGEAAGVETERHNLKAAVAVIAELARDHEVVVTHGTGPQVSLLALQATGYPLDVLGAETEGMIGYLLEQGLESELPDRQVATLLTQVVVDPADPAFMLPTEPIGPVYDEAVARVLAGIRGWLLRQEGTGWRRVAPCPEPTRILEIGTIRILVEAGVLVVCAGGGGIPVAIDDTGMVRGVEAVVDKDLAAALLAVELGADALVLLTDIDSVWTDFGTPGARSVAEAPPGSLRALGLPARSMGPKAEAACRFAEATGRSAFIGALADGRAVLTGSTGTRVGVDASGLVTRPAGAR